MAVLDPDDLLQQAEKLLSLYPRRKPRQTELRRAVSAAYYAVFHFILTSAADFYVGAVHRGSVRYSLVYRHLTHTRLRELCGQTAQLALPQTLSAYISGDALSRGIRLFSRSVRELQEQRHSADYDPTEGFTRGDALSAIAAARTAIQSFKNAPDGDRVMFLPLLLFPPRKN